MLADLLTQLLSQATEEKFTYSIVVVDNDRNESGREGLERFREMPVGFINYFVEPHPNIAAARNTAMAHASGNYIAFIDDDEVPGNNWLLTMYDALTGSKADGVLGPVKPRFTVNPPAWILKAGFFDRPNSQDYRSGTVLHWNQTGTGNVLIRRPTLEDLPGPFQTVFSSGGEDVDFFRRAMNQGKTFVWCAEAVAYETIPAERTRLAFQIKRALLRGKASLATAAGRPAGIVKSMAACGVYTILLPVSLVIGRHLFLRYLVRSCDHIGKLLAAAGINVVKENYVS